MQKQSARLYYQGKDHKDIYFQGKYHCAMYKDGEIIWEKYLDGKWVYNIQRGISFYRMETLDPIKKEVRSQAITLAPNMTYNNERYIVYTPYILAHFADTLFISNTGGNRLNNFRSLITRDFRFAAALNDRILVCDNNALYELRQNKEDKTYELFEVGELPAEFNPYILGKCGAFLVGNYLKIEDAKYKWIAFGKDNVFKEFAATHYKGRFCYCQDDDKVYILDWVPSNIYPYLQYPTVYIYDGKSTETLYPSVFAGKFIIDVAMIKRNGKFIIYESHDDGSSNYYVSIGVTSDFSKIVFNTFEKCTVQFENGFYVNEDFYSKVAFVSDTRKVSVDDDTIAVGLPINEIKKQIPVYYESGEINHDREDMVLPFMISGFVSTTFLVAYLDNLYFEESEGNFGR